jgi:hypothetical protein
MHLEDVQQTSCRQEHGVTSQEVVIYSWPNGYAIPFQPACFVLTGVRSKITIEYVVSLQLGPCIFKV